METSRFNYRKGESKKRGFLRGAICRRRKPLAPSNVHRSNYRRVVVVVVVVAASPPCSSPAGTARSSSASARRSLKRHRRWRPEGRVGSETRDARQPLPRVETAVTDIGASRPLESKSLRWVKTAAGRGHVRLLSCQIYHVCASHLSAAAAGN